MDSRTLRMLCANVGGLSVGQIRELRLKLHELDARREVLARVDARWQDFRRRGSVLPAGLSKWQVPVLTLAERAGARRAEMLPDRRAESLVAVLEARISRDAVLCSDGDGAYRLFAQAHGLPHYRLGARRGLRVIQTAFHIQTVNSLHSRLKAFLRPFCGPATKNLPAYLAWFIASLADLQTAQDNAWNQMLAA